MERIEIELGMSGSEDDVESKLGTMVFWEVTDGRGTAIATQLSHIYLRGRLGDVSERRCKLPWSCSAPLVELQL